ncbi:glycosyltransferase [Paenibacillus sp. DMB20]|uniref:glycosyltransferase n=1 Tax=Paenibacillus sp. DMB20 TaxID=1642570 RepID=UPI00069C787F|nr:glycosyltransferase [Paenibacillus sp. DMB20]
MKKHKRSARKAANKPAASGPRKGRHGSPTSYRKLPRPVLNAPTAGCSTPSAAPADPVPELHGFPLPVDRPLSAEGTQADWKKASDELARYDIFRFPVIDWDFRWQRPQQMSRQFALHHHRVFYMHPQLTGIRKEEATFEEVTRHVKFKNIAPNIWIVSLCSYQDLNIYKDAMSPLDIQYMKWSLDYAKSRFQVNHAVSIVDLPFWTPLVKAMDRHPVIYDCMDDHSGFSTNASVVLDQEGGLIRRSDMILTSSRLLHSRLRNRHPLTYLLRNAADVNFFNGSSGSSSPPPELQEVQGPILGYYGAISDWFDIGLIEYLAGKHPDWTFVLIGHTFGCDISRAEKLGNVMFLGEKPYTELPSYLKRFDVALIPFLNNALTQATNPVKLYEYLAAGKPVVSTRLPELEAIASDLAAICPTYEAFEKAVEKALTAADTRALTSGLAFASRNTWKQRYEELNGWILKDLFPSVSIIIVTHNNWSYTEQCLKRLLGKDRYPNMEIVIVDNGSTDQTPMQLKTVESRSVKVIYSSENLGFASGNSLGCREASGQYLILLNNDTIVPDGSWVSRLLRPMLQHPEIGMTGPMSNHVGNDQAVDHFAGNPVHGADPNWLKDFYSFYKGSIRDTELLGFFCVAMRREIFDHIGPLDPAYGIGMFEDDDYCEQVKQLGYRLVVVEDAFVYHHGSATIKKLAPAVYESLWEKNKTYYEQKWNKEWQWPKRPDSIFDLAETADEVSKRIPSGRKCVLILGNAAWTVQSQRWQQMVRALADQEDCLVIAHVQTYYQYPLIGIRKIGKHLYFTNRLDLFEETTFDAVIYCGEPHPLPNLKAWYRIADSLCYSRDQLEVLRSEFPGIATLQEPLADPLIQQILRPLARI